MHLCEVKKMQYDLDLLVYSIQYYMLKIALLHLCCCEWACDVSEKEAGDSILCHETYLISGSAVYLHTLND